MLSVRGSSAKAFIPIWWVWPLVPPSEAERRHPLLCAAHGGSGVDCRSRPILTRIRAGLLCGGCSCRNGGLPLWLQSMQCRRSLRRVRGRPRYLGRVVAQRRGSGREIFWAWARNAKKKASMSEALRRNACVRGDSDRPSHKKCMARANFVPCSGAGSTPRCGLLSSSLGLL